jgi:hypothetical protein
MNATTTLNPEAISLLREGWHLLIDQLGIQNATRFVILIERGQGDSVEDIARYWGDKTIDEIHQQVMTWKSMSPQHAAT